jgi:hypothetical protein
MGKDEYNALVRSQVHLAGDQAFLHGVSHISQMTGMEHRALERSHMCIVANAPGSITESVTRATQAAMEVIYLAQLPTQSDRSLQAYRAAHKDFMEHRQGWIDNGSRRGKSHVIPHFHIPKMHVIRHLEEHVRLKGTADNYSTETMEHLHIDMVKDAYRASNRREWKVQTARWLTRREKIRDFEAWMIWCQSEKEKEMRAKNCKFRQINPDKQKLTLYEVNSNAKQILARKGLSNRMQAMSKRILQLRERKAKESRTEPGLGLEE